MKISEVSTCVCRLFSSFVFAVLLRSIPCAPTKNPSVVRVFQQEQRQPNQYDDHKTKKEREREKLKLTSVCAIEIGVCTLSVSERRRKRTEKLGERERERGKNEEVRHDSFLADDSFVRNYSMKTVV